MFNDIISNKVIQCAYLRPSGTPGFLMIPAVLMNSSCSSISAGIDELAVLDEEDSAPTFVSTKD